MKIIKASADTITNFESLDLLRSRGDRMYASRAIATVSQSEFKVFDYLEGTVACNQTREIIDNFVARGALLKLNRLSIFDSNVRITCRFKYQMLIEECESRMEDKAEELVETITRILPHHPSQVDEANVEAAKGEEEVSEPEQAAEGDGEGQEEEVETEP
ncbi:uncharacterized protein LOC121784180 [Salvia splendens]|uniref:uncharacterized protein LOC121784180 n=1 Tax=Salvia splendens TaxID=180675 RepID=UPI001C2762D9|nr:uncharacterized protein LOC121784180 [Salvia splendens]